MIAGWCAAGVYEIPAAQKKARPCVRDKTGLRWHGGELGI